MEDGDLGEGARLAAASGAWICFEDEACETCARPGPAPGRRAAIPP